MVLRFEDGTFALIRIFTLNSKILFSLDSTWNLLHASTPIQLVFCLNRGLVSGYVRCRTGDEYLRFWGRRIMATEPVYGCSSAWIDVAGEATYSVAHEGLGFNSQDGGPYLLSK